MTHTPKRLLAVALLAAAASVSVGCNKTADAPAPAAKSAEKDPDAIPGLKDEKQRVSYMIGLDIGETLKTVKDDIDMPTLEKALRTTLKGEKPLMDEKQAQKVREAFGQKVQARRAAEQAEATKKNAEAGQAFLAKNAKNPGVRTTPSGLQYQVIREGTGPKPKESDVVQVHYQGTLLDGKKFDSSYERGQPAMIPLQQVVPGWREGIQLMSVGSKYKLWLPAALAYGEAGTPGGPIAPNSTLVFEVELLGIGDKPAQ